jgi:AcrR family transcriptional regulator
MCSELTLSSLLVNRIILLSAFLSDKNKNIRSLIMTNRSLKKATTRRALIDATLRLSAERGFAGLSLREIAREAGITPTAFYRHFRDLDDLGLTLIDEVALSLRQLMRQARQRTREKRSVVKASVEAFMDFIQQNSNLFRLFLGERSGSSPAFRRAIRLEMDRFISELADDLNRIVKASGRPMSDTPLTAEAIVAVVFTVGAEALDLSKGEGKKLAERIVREIRIILRGAELG